VIRLALRGIAARKLRVFATTFAVFLGVGLVTATYVLTDTINASFDDIFKESLKGTDVVVTSKEPVRTDQGQPPPFRASILNRVRRVEGVDAATGAIFTPGGFFDAKGHQVGSHLSPKFISSLLPKRFETLRYVEGRKPRTASETSLDSQSADRSNVRIGERLTVAGERRARSYRVVGITKLGKTSFGGAAIAQLVLPEAQRITDKQGEFDQISVAAADGVGADELKQKIQAALPRDLRVETAKQSAERQSQQIADDLGFFRVALLVFAGVALFVGAFLIFNTFSITIAQRVREFGMLRTLGASQQQVLRSVLAEAAVIGLLGSVIGVVGGMGFAPAINALFKAVGIDLPNTGTVLETRTVVVAFVVGMAVTLVSALPPVLRATRIPPMAALREAEIGEGRRRGVLYAVLAVMLAVAGVALTSLGLFGGIESSGQAAGLMGAGAVLVLLGVSLFSPRLVRPLASVAGAPMERLRGLTGRLARENAMRKPTRTAVTSAALMIGLALVVFVTVFAAGFNTSISRAIDRNFQGDLTVQNIDNFSPIPSRIAGVARGIPGVEAVSSLRFSEAKVRGQHGDQRVSAVEPASVNRLLKLDWAKGSPDTLQRLGPRDAVIDHAWGDSHGIGLGDRMTLLTPASKHVSVTVKGEVKDNADLIGDFILTQGTMASAFEEKRDTLTLIKVAPSASAGAVQRRLAHAINRRFPTAEVLNQKELKDRQETQIRQLLGLIYALLSLTVLVSLFGILNTLALSIYERTRELGMLRAIGMSRRHVKRMIRYEAVITALIGAILGTALGTVFAALVSRPLADQGFVLSYPVPTLVLVFVLAALGGVLAAIWPARRAADLDVLDALAYE
jgi:putative ABC transport system permease protein